ncbi:MAG TPA: exodeoxyribonuclease V subunit alpha [Acidimicrobiales bacterium]|nr:exodeoxyribonuclease V subunit alpha [Acidimicrobiales bacterium]
MLVTALNRDPFTADVAIGARPLLLRFNGAGVLAPADIHVAERLAKLGEETDERVILATALAVRGPRFGHVRTALRGVRSTVVADVEDRGALDLLPWPEEEDWLKAVAASRIVAIGQGGVEDRPLRLVDEALYLDRYWRDECFVADDLLQRSGGPQPVVDRNLLEEGLQRMFGRESPPEQKSAAAAAVLRRFSVVAGGPGTGKTTTVAKVIALLHEQAAANGEAAPLIALAAPTGKAAARMEEAVRHSVSDLDTNDEIRERLASAEGLTIHRLLRRRPDSSSRFRHDRNNRLPHDAVIVDETSMVSLSLMARLLEAIRSDARVILIGDPEQLASVEAGAVLGDIVGPASSDVGLPASSDIVGSASDYLRLSASPKSGSVAEGIVVLRSNFRFGGCLAELASAIRAGDADSAVAVLSQGNSELRWLDIDPVEGSDRASASDDLAPVREMAVSAGRGLFEAAIAGDEPSTLRFLSAFRLLCAHRHGAGGVDVWTEIAEAWLAQEIEGFDPGPEWYPGRPVMITANDYSLRLFNGDTGAVVVREDAGLAVVFPRGGSAISVSPSRLSAVETVFATTVHKSQGSEFEQAALVLPPPESPLLTRELLYTAVTRAKRGLTVVGPEESLRVAVSRPVARASGLTRRLWG